MFIFPREDQAWALDHNTKHVWGGLLANAVECLNLPLDPDSVRWPRTLLLPSLYLLEFNGQGLGKQKRTRHEAIPKNMILTVPIMLRNTDGEQQLATPSVQQLTQIFSFIGQYEGISPFGSAAGYGQFDVQSVYPVGRTIFDVGGISEGLPEGNDIHGEEDGSGRPGPEEERPV